MKTQWDSQSGIRERLALLADLGPSLKESHWGYHPSRDLWYHCGPHGERSATGQTEGRKVRQEGAASLAIIKKQWGLDYKGAMARIGGGA